MEERPLSVPSHLLPLVDHLHRGHERALPQPAGESFPHMKLYSLLTLACACTAKGYCSRSVYLSVSRSVGRSVGRLVGLCVYLFPRFLSNRGCCRYQTWICGYVQRALGTARVWSGVVQEQHVYGGDLKL